MAVIMVTEVPGDRHERQWLLDARHRLPARCRHPLRDGLQPFVDELPAPQTSQAIGFLPLPEDDTTVEDDEPSI